jgi:hypothetical protein
VADQNAVRAAPRDADGGPARKGVLGGLPLSQTAIPEPKQDVPCGPSLDAIAAARDLIGAGSAALTIDFHPGRNPVVPVMSGLNSLGVDLGLEGGIAMLSPSAELLAIADMPTLRDGTNNRRSGPEST